MNRFLITILIGKTTHALEYEEASIAASAIQPIAFKSNKLRGAFGCKLPIRTKIPGHTFSLQKEKI
jgi:hypothetical protein